MANRPQHNWLFLMGLEGTYGTANTTPNFKSCDTFEPSWDIEEIEINDTHHGHLWESANDSHQGRKAYSITQRGMLTHSHGELLRAILLDAGQTYSMPDEDPGYSFTLTLAYNPSSSALTVGKQAVGCRVNTWSFKRNGGYFDYEINWICKDYDNEADISSYVATGLSDTNFNFPEYKPFLWKLSEASIRDEAGVTNVIDYSISGTNEHLEDDASFGNSETRYIDQICSGAAEVTGKVIYDTVKDASIYENLFGDIADETFIMKDEDANSWTLTMHGKYSGYSLPSEKICLYQSEYTLKTKTSNSLPGLTITVSS